MTRSPAFEPRSSKRNVLIVGAGGVARVVAHKCAQNSAVLGAIHLASRTVDKCREIADSIAVPCAGGVHAHAIDALDAAAVVALIRSTESRIVINVATPFVNTAVLSACVETGAAYIDTAIHEDPDRVCETPPWYANHEWKHRVACRDAGVTAILGAGFDPGVVNAYARFAVDRLFDRVESIDIIDVNAGKHGRYFATNFDPEINFREFVATAWSWERGQWQANAMFDRHCDWDLPVAGVTRTYLTGHDEVHSLSQHLDVPDIRFWMGFSEHYIKVFGVLKALGLLSEKPVRTARGQSVVPLEVVKAVLPDPTSLAPGYTGKTCIGDLLRGRRGGQPYEVLLYNVCDHAQCYAEVGSQAISYTAGVPAVAAALLIADGTWDVRRMVNVEELDPPPFIALLERLGLATRMRDAAGDRPLDLRSPSPQLAAASSRW